MVGTVRQHDPKCVSAPGYRFGNRALFLTQILTQNRKFRYGRSSTKGKLPFEYPYRKAPNGRFSAEKTPWPILLSSRSGVRVPPGVPNSPNVRRLEQFNATRMSVAGDGWTEPLLD